MPGSLHCGGFANSYVSSCFYYDAIPNKDIINYMDILQLQRLRRLSFAEFQNIAPSDQRALLKALQYNSYFDALTIDNTTLSREATFSLAEMLVKNRSIKKVNLAGAGVSGHVLRDWLQKKSRPGAISLTHLNISRNPLGDAGFELLGDWIRASEVAIAELDVSDCNGSPAGVIRLCQSLLRKGQSKSALVRLNLSGNKMDTEGSVALASLLSTESSIQDLYLRDTDAVTEVIANALVEGCLDHLQLLSLSGNSLGRTAGLGQFLKEAKAFRVLDLSNCQLTIQNVLEVVRNVICNFSILRFSLNLHNAGIDCEIAEMLAALLARNIRSLDLSSNPLGDSGVEAFFGSLSPSCSVEVLSLSYCFQGRTNERPRAIEAIANFIRQTKTLKQLHLRADTRTALRLDIIPIIEAMAKNESIDLLDISGHEGGDPVALSLGRMLQQNKRLTTLEVDNNNFTASGFFVFIEGLRRNRSLRKMPIPLNDVFFAARSAGSTAVNLRGIVAEIENTLLENQTAALSPTREWIRSSVIGPSTVIVIANSFK